MEKQKKKLFISLCIVGALLSLTIILFALRVLPLVVFIIGCSIEVVLLVLFIVFFIKVIKKMKQKKKEEIVPSTGNYMIDIYVALGIPIQYNKDGSIKSIFELLGIDPEYDEEGNRIPTIYEMLGIMPLFDEQGNEIPSVLIIKNRVKRIAKVDLSARVLTRKLTEAEKEEKIIRETLKKKYDEAKQQGDNEKAESIKKVITEKSKKPKKQESSSANKPKYVMGKSKGPVKAVSIQGVPRLFDPKSFFNLSAAVSKPKSSGVSQSKDKEKEGGSEDLNQAKPSKNNDQSKNKLFEINSKYFQTEKDKKILEISAVESERER